MSIYNSKQSWFRWLYPRQRCNFCSYHPMKYFNPSHLPIWLQPIFRYDPKLLKAHRIRKKYRTPDPHKNYLGRMCFLYVFESFGFFRICLLESVAAARFARKNVPCQILKIGFFSTIGLDLHFNSNCLRFKD